MQGWEGVCKAGAWLSVRPSQPLLASLSPCCWLRGHVPCSRTRDGLHRGLSSPTSPTMPHFHPQLTYQGALLGHHQPRAHRQRGSSTGCHLAKPPGEKVPNINRSLAGGGCSVLSTQGLRSPRGPDTGLRGQGEQAEGAGLALGRRRGARNGFHFHIYVNASKFSPPFIFYFFFSSKMEISMKTCSICSPFSFTNISMKTVRLVLSRFQFLISWAGAGFAPSV